MINRKFFLLIPLLTLCACQSEAERQAEFLKPCLDAQFSPKQCAFMYILAKNQQEQTDANLAISISMTSMALSSSMSK